MNQKRINDIVTKQQVIPVHRTLPPVADTRVVTLKLTQNQSRHQQRRLQVKEGHAL